MFFQSLQGYRFWWVAGGWWAGGLGGWWVGLASGLAGLAGWLAGWLVGWYGMVRLIGFGQDIAKEMKATGGK